MKKIGKKLFGLGVFLASNAVVNSLIFQQADLFTKDNYEENLYYEYKFGKIRYNVLGKKELPPLVLIHGICAGGSSREWESIITPLSLKYRVYAIDLLGFGASDRPNISYNSYMYVDMINSFISTVIGKPCHVIGSNTSADFVLLANKLMPSNFNKLVLVNPSGLVKPKLYGSPSDKLTKTLFQLPILGTSCYNMICSRASIKYFLKKYVYTNQKLVTDEEVNKYYYAGHFKGVLNKMPISYFASKFLNLDTSKALLQCKTDVLAVFGEDNKFIPVYESRDFAKNNSNVTTIIFPFTKTLPHVERNILFEKKISEFLEG